MHLCMETSIAVSFFKIYFPSHCCIKLLTCSVRRKAESMAHGLHFKANACSRYGAIDRLIWGGRQIEVCGGCSFGSEIRRCWEFSLISHTLFTFGCVLPFVGFSSRCHDKGEAVRRHCNCISLVCSLMHFSGICRTDMRTL